MRAVELCPGVGGAWGLLLLWTFVDVLIVETKQVHNGGERRAHSPGVTLLP